MRLHTEKIRPPRALWVPFELGRPLGVPNDAPFQTRVLCAALDLLQRTAGPVLEDYLEDAPSGAEEDGEGWVCPISLPVPDSRPEGDAALLDEIQAMRSWYDLARRRRGRTAVGTSGMEIEEIARYLAAWTKGEMPDKPPGNNEMDASTLLRVACDDIKAYYSEGATAQPGRNGRNPSAKDIAVWFWSTTQAANLLLKLRQVLSNNEDRTLALVAQFLIVPYTETDRQPPSSLRRSPNPP